MTSFRNAVPAQQGFTLIELMIVLVIIGIIGSIAMATFSGSGQDAERTRIIAELNAINDAMSRYYQGNYSYVFDGTDAEFMAALRGNGPQGGTAIAASPLYNVSVVVSADGQGYTLVARPVAGGLMEGEGAYSVNERGQRCSFVGNDAADPAVDACESKW